MSTAEIFAKQIAEHTKEIYFYGIETVRDGEDAIEIRSHKGSLDDFPPLEYVRYLTDGIPLFRSKE